MVALKNILVATDFSEPSSVAMAYGRDLARTYNARLHVMHVVEDVMLRYSSEVGLALPALQEDLVKAARKELESRLTDEDREQLKAVPVARHRRQHLGSDLRLRQDERHRSDRRPARTAAARSSTS